MYKEKKITKKLTKWKFRIVFNVFISLVCFFSMSLPLSFSLSLSVSVNTVTGQSVSERIDNQCKV